MRHGGDELVLPLSGSWNFRDVSEQAGIQPGRLFRSGELSNLDDAGRETLARLNVTDVADLRSAPELERHGKDLVPDSVTIHHLPFVETIASDADAPHEHAFQKMLTEKPEGESVSSAAARYMTEEYARIARSPLAQRAVRKVVTILGDEGRLLAHCFAGKDRTGFTIAVVLEAAGVDRDAVMADYLASNAAVPELRTHIVETIRTRMPDAEVADVAEARLTDAVLGVQEAYLDAARRAIADDFGSLTGYLDAAGVTRDEVAKLRTVLLG
ncbi:phosphotyrosine protein phosphatase [Mycobacteriaceae bacterium 1482268.1]|nr:phosphotyrosine protein phosphatase [Mycobacteriaceae bacterium 1482268.1]